MRILHVTDTFLPRLGGIELHVADLAARQHAEGHDVLVLTAESMRADAVPARSPGDVRVVRLRSGLTGTRIGAALGSEIAAFAPDVMHAHLSVGSPFAWAALRNAAGVPALVSVHSLLPPVPFVVRAGIRIARLPVTHITFTAVSEAAARRVRPALPSGQPVHVLHNGIDPAQWAVQHRPTGGFNIVAVGRLAARKRPMALVAALAELDHSVPDLPWSATVIGDGPQRQKVLAAVRAHGLEDRIAMPGGMTREAIRSHLAGADVLVAPATLESFGIAALEARCAGVPIVAMAASGVTEFVTDGVDGLLARTDAGLADSLIRLASDPVLRRRLRRNSALSPVGLDWQTVLTEHERLYGVAIKNAGRPAVAGRRRRVVVGAAR